jgi:hypothetical protein
VPSNSFDSEKQQLDRWHGTSKLHSTGASSKA